MESGAIFRSVKGLLSALLLDSYALCDFYETLLYDC
ncbi:hypothetical protein EVA_01566 [gut metagenome]|uniref:Uncharacterized protein n=1 Tax=gut metagenome TaxID=749906 RepID=J9H2Z4_9ZZZZ